MQTVANAYIIIGIAEPEEFLKIYFALLQTVGDYSDQTFVYHQIHLQLLQWKPCHCIIFYGKVNPNHYIAHQE